MLGPPSNKSTLTGSIKYEYDNFNGLFVNVLAELASITFDIGQNVNSYLDQLNLSQRELRSFNQSLIGLDNDSIELSDKVLLPRSEEIPS